MSNYLVGKRIQFDSYNSEAIEKTYTGTVQGFFQVQRTHYTLLLLTDDNKFYEVSVSEIRNLKILDNINNNIEKRNKFENLDL